MTPTPLSRRNLLLGSASLVLVSAGALSVAASRRPQWAVEAIIRKVFGPDLIDEEGVRQFAAAYLRHTPSSPLGRGVVGTAVAASYPNPLIQALQSPELLGGLGSPYDNAATSVANFVMKYSNFLYRGRKERLTYVERVETEPFACRNPLARFDDDD